MDRKLLHYNKLYTRNIAATAALSLEAEVDGLYRGASHGLHLMSMGMDLRGMVTHTPAIGRHVAPIRCTVQSCVTVLAARQQGGPLVNVQGQLGMDSKFRDVDLILGSILPPCPVPPLPPP